MAEQTMGIPARQNYNELLRQNERQRETIEQLEQLCNDLFNHVCAEQIGARVNMAQFVELSERMDDLGLMEEFHD